MKKGNHHRQFVKTKLVSIDENKEVLNFSVEPSSGVLPTFPQKDFPAQKPILGASSKHITNPAPLSSPQPTHELAASCPPAHKQPSETMEVPTPVDAFYPDWMVSLLVCSFAGFGLYEIVNFFITLKPASQGKRLARRTALHLLVRKKGIT